ncbi:MAG: DUF1674 domain-containing protein [Sulfitobacter sp.]|nr:DUF1674 domain-containing protein [Sulfitobacter sp.]
MTDKIDKQALQAGRKPIPDTPPQPEPVPEPDLPPPPTPGDPAPSPIPPAAQRALAEAEARRKAGNDLNLPPELGGRDGPEPVRYGDWEKKGIAIDF